MTERKANLSPLQGFEGLNYDESRIKRQEEKRQEDFQKAKTFMNNFYLVQKKKGREEKIKLIRHLSNKNYLNVPEVQGLLDCLIFPTIESLNLDGYIDPAQAFQNQTTWAQFLLKEYLNNQNIVYYKITNPQMIKSSALNARIMNEQKLALAGALTNAGINKALCAFDVKVSFSYSDNDYLHNIVTHVFYDEKDHINNSGLFQMPLISEYGFDVKVTTKNVYNDIKLFADTLKPFCSRTIPMLRKSSDGYSVSGRSYDPCLHLYYIFSDMTFQDRLLFHGYKLEIDGKNHSSTI